MKNTAKMMISFETWKRLAIPLVFIAGLFTALAVQPPRVGDAAPDFTLKTLDDKPVELRQLTASTPVVLVVLRGWPGYQCPICTRQVHDFVAHAREFAARKARVLMVYPGPARNLKAHAQDFLQDKQRPREFLFVTDPDFSMVNAYGLRWNAPHETSYPSTFILATNGLVRFAHISHSHGDRVSAPTALEALVSYLKRDGLLYSGPRTNNRAGKNFPTAE